LPPAPAWEYYNPKLLPATDAESKLRARAVDAKTAAQPGNPDLYDKGIVIVGGGHGGSQVAASLREKGHQGRLTLVTAETDIPYQRPPLSKAYLKDLAHALLPLRPESFYAKNGVELRLGAQVTAIDKAGALVLSDGNSVPFDRLVLATGARPRLPPISGIGLHGVYTLRNAADARALRAALHQAIDVVVVGGGFIGLEIAATARLLGKTVTVLEAAGRLMGRAVAPEISAHFLALHRGWGSDVRLDTAVGTIVGEGGRVVAVTDARGSRIPADLAVIGIGVHPNVELATAIGIAADNGIAVDDLMQTSNPQVLAIGDCVSFQHWATGKRERLESVQNAVDQGKTAAATLAGKREPYRAVPWFWSDQGDVKLQMVGIPHGATRSVLRGNPDAGAFSVFHYVGERMIAVDSVNRASDHMVGRRLLEAGVSPPVAVVADEGVDLKSLVARQRPPATAAAGAAAG
jgi:3-phenylpropionate/trans-cinnamate dioxygenase ferredoxin reductase subunit